MADAAGRSSRVWAGRRSRHAAVVGSLSLVVVATGCYVPWDLNGDKAADVAWVSVVDTGDPATSHVVLTRHGATDPAEVGVEGSTSWLAGDLDGNKRFELVTEHPDGTWRSTATTVAVAPTITDVTDRFLADFAPDAGMEVAYYAETTGTWEVQDVGIVTLGQPGDVPVPADYDGDGTTDLAVYRPATGRWWLAGATEPLAADVGIGLPAPADYDGDGIDEPAVHDLLTGEVRIDGMAVAPTLPLGIPAPADYDADGTEDPAVVTTDATTGERVLTIVGQGEHRQPLTADGGPTPWTARTHLIRHHAAIAALSATPLPLTGRGNHLGTGRLGFSTATGSPYSPESYTLNLNGYCVSKNQGDRISAGFRVSENCTGATNPEYDPNGALYTITLPEDRTYDTDVLVFDGGYLAGTGSSGSCPDSCRNDGDQLLEPLELPPSLWFPADFNPGGGTQGPMTTTFRLHAPSSGDPLAVPLDADPTACAPATRSFTSSAGAAGSTIAPRPTGTKSFAPDTKFGMTNTGYVPDTAFRDISVGWWNLCRIPATAPAGDYTLHVSNGGSQRNGSNNFAVVADRVGQSGLCLAEDPTCPVLSARRHATVRAAAPLSTARFPILALDESAAGRTLRVELWDPGEGGQAIRLLRPTDTGGLVPVTFTWRDDSGNGQQDVTALPVSSYDFNGHLATLETTIPAGYDPASEGARWYIEYDFSSSAVTDVTTWSADLVGAPPWTP